MKAYELKTKKGEVLLRSTKPIKHAATIPTPKIKPLKAIAFPNSDKISKNAHLTKLARSQIAIKKNAGITRRAKALKIMKLSDGRRVYIKSTTKQTKRSAMNPHIKINSPSAQAQRENKAVAKIVQKINIDRLNECRKKQLEAAGKKYTPIPYKKPLDMHGFKGKYVAGPKPKRVVKVTNLPEKVTEKQVKFALKRSAAYADKIKLCSYKTKAAKNAPATKKTFALIYTKSEQDAKALVKNRLQKMKVDSKKVGLSIQAINKMGPSKKKIAAHKKAAEAEKSRIKSLRQRNQERHEANQKRASRRRHSRRHPKYEDARILRDPKSHRIYAIKQNKAAKQPKAERKPMHAYKKLRSMVRISRK